MVSQLFNFIEHQYAKLALKSRLRYYKSMGAEINESVRFAGLPLFRISKNSNIIIGQNCLVNSNYQSNVAGVIMPCFFSTIKEGAKIVIGNNVGISGASIVSAEEIIIEDDVLIGAGACIWDTDFHPIDPEFRKIDKNSNYFSKSIYIEKNVFIGARSIILKGVRIGENSVIGAGSVVASDVPPNAIFAGNPAKLVKYFNKIQPIENSVESELKA